MAYRWGEIQIESLKKMFLNNKDIYEENLDAMRKDNKYKIYLNAMPQAANEAIAECMKRGRPYLKTFEFTQYPLDNLIGNDFKTMHFAGDSYAVEVKGALSYYFEVDNKCLVTIYVMADGEYQEFKVIENKAVNPGEYTVYKGFIDNPNKELVKLVFSGSNPYNVRNVALYYNDYNYRNNSIAYIPDYKPYNIYDLSTLVDDFYKIDKLYHENESHELKNRSDYIMEDSKTLILDKNLQGNFILKYQPYSDKITLNTKDTDELALEDEVAVIIPLYIASQLYKDDDIAMSTMYRNEFETAVENLYPSYNDLEFVSKSGWL